jgi:hypothetical protein
VYVTTFRRERDASGNAYEVATVNGGTTFRHRPDVDYSTKSFTLSIGAKVTVYGTYTNANGTKWYFVDTGRTGFSKWTYVKQDQVMNAPVVSTKYGLKGLPPSKQVTQGFTLDTNVDPTYCYFATSGSDDTQQGIWRYKINGGSVVEKVSDFTTLLHANDLALVKEGNDIYLYVAAYRYSQNAKAKPAIVKLKREANGSFSEYKRYEFNDFKNHNNNTVNAETFSGFGGITVLNPKSNETVFLLKTGGYFYTVSIAHNYSGKITPSFAFSADRGSTFKTNNYGNQGIQYTGGKLYDTLYGKKDVGKENVSVILTYDYDKISISSQNVKHIESWEFIAPKGIETFEVESIGFRNNELWFITNQHATRTSRHGGIYSFNTTNFVERGGFKIRVVKGFQ